MRASLEALRVSVGKGEKKWEKGRKSGRRGKRGMGGGVEYIVLPIQLPMQVRATRTTVQEQLRFEESSAAASRVLEGSGGRRAHREKRATPLTPRSLTVQHGVLRVPPS